MAVITISRQYGSGGDEIAARVCEMLGYHQFNKRLMAEIAVQMGLQENEVVDFSEDTYKARNFLERLFGTKQHVVAEVGVWTVKTTGALTKEVAKLDEEQSITMVRGAIERGYKYGNIVIVGRGGQAILKDKPDVLHVRIVAPLKTRIQHIQEWENVSQEEAQKIVTIRDRATADYLKHFYDIDVSDTMFYHLVLNTGKWDIETATQIIIKAVNSLAVIESSG